MSAIRYICDYGSCCARSFLRVRAVASCSKALEVFRAACRHHLSHTFHGRSGVPLRCYLAVFRVNFSELFSSAVGDASNRTFQYPMHFLLHMGVHKRILRRNQLWSPLLFMFCVLLASGIQTEVNVLSLSANVCAWIIFWRCYTRGNFKNLLQSICNGETVVCGKGMIGMEAVVCSRPVRNQSSKEKCFNGYANEATEFTILN